MWAITKMVEPPPEGTKDPIRGIDAPERPGALRRQWCGDVGARGATL